MSRGIIVTANFNVPFVTENEFANKKVLLINTQEYDGAVNMAEFAMRVAESCASLKIVDVSDLKNLANNRFHSLLKRYFQKRNQKQIFSRLPKGIEYFYLEIEKDKRVRYTESYPNFTNQEKNILTSGIRNAEPSGFIDQVNIKNKKIAVKTERISKTIYSNIERFLEKQSFDVLITYNGRFLIPSILYILCKRRKKDIGFIEGGPSPQSFEFYRISPHSNQNRAEIMLDFWKRNENCHDRIKVAKDYVSRRILMQDEKFLRLFQSRFKKSSHEDSVNRYSQYVIYYLSSQWENPSFEVDNLFSIFENQEDSIKAIRDICLKNKLKFVVKIHPNPSNLAYEKFEDDYWQKFLKNEKIEFIGATSEINTYELIRIAHTNIVYQSSVGAVCSLLGIPFIVLKDVDWSILISPIAPKNLAELENLIIVPVKFQDPRIYSYFFYLDRGGVKYCKFIYESETKILFEGKNILSCLDIFYRNLLKRFSLLQKL
jgi:hypothetical protein